MPEFGGLGKMLIFMGLGIVVIGIILSLIGKLPNEGSGLGWLGKLPGDIRIERPGLRIYIPLMSCVLLSAILSALFWLLSKLR